jgi:2,3,4,5-tetrahydropyridine-2-carboxylate N-succinyltransferase
MTPVETQSLQSIIEAGWERREALQPTSAGWDELRKAVESVIAALDDGALRIAEPVPIAVGPIAVGPIAVGGEGTSQWQVHQWLKKAVLMYFRLNDMALMPGGPGGASWFDKVPSKFQGWDEARFRRAGFRAVPNSVVRRGAYVAPGVVLMPSFVNIGAYIDRNSMIDAWATVGSCAQIGRNCHISGGAGIGGVLEPLQANPVVIEDDCFIGARAEVAEGVIVERGSVLSMGVYLGASTKIVDRETGEIFQGRVPAYSVVVPGALPGKPLAGANPGGILVPSLYCAVIVKRVDAKTRAKTSINELLRD